MSNKEKFLQLVSESDADTMQMVRDRVVKRKIKSIFTYIKAAKFFPKYAPSVVAWKKKLSGKNSNGNPIDFTDVDKAAIKKGFDKMYKELK